MYKERLKELTHSVLLDASQLAFIEEAPKTFNLLDSYLKFFRYLSKEKEKECLDYEIEVIEHYINIQRTHYDFNFEVAIDKDKMLKTIFITKSSLIAFFDKLLINILSQEEKCKRMALEFEIQNGQVKVILEVSYLNKAEIFSALL
ncbi:histidine kinase [Cellulosilyticum sp. I15G10I2]|uniref:histidine kinase n=1 Tax=Cellulosilyticum sp. I15G10I2 TaxID=1892843 RepID=UPI00085CBF34|nr:histidine kinase [Cellulosilyticum sp. I15G10I2]